MPVPAPLPLQHSRVGGEPQGKISTDIPIAWRHRLLKLAKKQLFKKETLNLMRWMMISFWNIVNSTQIAEFIYTLKIFKFDGKSWFFSGQTKAGKFCQFLSVSRDVSILPTTWTLLPTHQPLKLLFNPDPCHLGHPGSMIFNWIQHVFHVVPKDQKTSETPSRFLVFTSASDPLEMKTCHCLKDLDPFGLAHFIHVLLQIWGRNPLFRQIDHRNWGVLFGCELTWSSSLTLRKAKMKLQV